MDILDIFKEFGLKEDHLKIYEANLVWGTTTISNISYKSKVPRSSVYELITDLIDLDLIKVSIKEESKLYTASDPEIIKDLLEKKNSKINNLILDYEDKMKQLKAIQNNKKNKPKVYILEGVEGVKKAYDMTYEAKEVLVQCLTDDYGDVPASFFSEYFDKFFKETNVKSKEILAEGEDDNYINKYSSKKNLQLRIPVSGDTSTDLMIYEDKVVFVSFEKGSTYSLVVEDAKVANAMKILYNLAWESAAKKDKRVQAGKEVLVNYEN